MSGPAEAPHHRITEHEAWSGGFPGTGADMRSTALGPIPPLDEVPSQAVD